jgi:hypothetical protein
LRGDLRQVAMAMNPAKPSTSRTTSSHGGMTNPPKDWSGQVMQRKDPAGIRRRRRGRICSCLSNATSTWRGKFRSARPAKDLLQKF